MAKGKFEHASLWLVEPPPQPYVPPYYLPPHPLPLPPCSPPYMPPSPTPGPAPPPTTPAPLPPYNPPPPPSPTPSRNVVVIVVVPIAGLVFLGLLAGLFMLAWARRRREETTTAAAVVEVDDVEVAHHVRAEEHVVAGPAGEMLKVLDVTDEVDVHEHVVRHERERDDVVEREG
ncbi:protein TRACHEARY ELEMENT DIFFERENTIATION-RELATED 7-like [Oryza brachyantha]|uniref:protein TRACHEARY ELEMENT DIFFERENTIATION-RELATED 7-like n=1 Tax=Oryza brachyantha TaxID=4533 RepID=UPI001ADC6D77|nr:protein TRACHEARY ELEMENT DIFFERENTIATION-RELATED 7-like [Oryza brachyantha]